MNLEGRLLGNRYEIIEKIGNGGMATVYKAKCHILNRFVAIKILRDEFTTDDEFVKRFNAEAQAAASLTHPNIVAIYDVGHEGDLYYIVMELVKGKTLKEIIVEDGAIAWKWSVNVAIQIASALETAHRNNIIHRDIKPHNIIITEDGIAKVTDFGIAKAVSNSTITAFGTTIGSVHYFSPEHARGGYTDAKSDLYSLGVVLYEMLTGKVPFDADTPVSVALKHMQEKPIEPMQLNPHIPKAVNDIVMKAMQKDANLRYSNATEMLKDLSMALKNPEGNFVIFNQNSNDFPTQKIPTVNGKIIEENIENNKVKNERKKEKKENFIKKHKVLSSIIGIILLFVIAFGITYYVMTVVKLKDVQIPNLVGLSTEEAKSKTLQSNLVYEISDEEYSADVPLGYVISQEPAFVENYRIKEKNVIKVIVSKGQKTVVVPKVIGEEKSKAIEILEALEIKVEVKEEYNQKLQAGYVISQDIAENTTIKAGETVTITISKGIEMVDVPNLIGKTEEEAKKAIEDAGLKLNTVINSEDTSKDDGTVLKQSIDAGSSVEKDSTITITVNQIAKLISGTVKVNLKSLINYTDVTEVDNTTGETVVKEPGKVKLRIVVGDDTIFSESRKKNETNINASFSGKGTVTVKVYVDDVLKSTKTLNLNSETTLIFE